MRGVLWVLLLFIAGCASQTRSVANSLDRQSSASQTSDCRRAAALAAFHDDIKMTRVIGTPLVLLATGGGALLAMLATNMGLDAVDRLDASNVSVSCGGPETPSDNLLEEVILGAGFNLFTGTLK